MALNAAKIAREAGRYLYAFEHPPAATHADGAYVNKFVEAARASPYTAGHAAALRLPPVLYARIVRRLFKEKDA